MVGERESRQACSILGTKKGGEWVRKVVPSFKQFTL